MIIQLSGEGEGCPHIFMVLCNETKIWLDIDCSIYTLDENHLFLYNILTLRQKKNTIISLPLPLSSYNNNRIP